MKLLSTCLFIFIFSAIAFGWNARGHMTVAAVAYRQLEKDDPQALKAINELLKSQPSYQTWAGEYRSDMPYSLEAYCFMRASIWSDDIRANAYPEHGDHQARWHFVNYPVRLPDSIDFKTVEPKTSNIFIAYDRVGKLVIRTDVDAPSRAKSLSWIFHLVGDVHQPLHSVALKTDEYPAGDSGGNAFCVRPGKGTYANNLHSFWDGLLKEKSKDIYTAREAWQDSIKLMTTGTADASGDITSWAQESAKLALTNVYQFEGKPLKLWRTVKEEGSSRARCPIIPDEDILDSRYTAAAQMIAEQRMLTAGMRLEKVLSGMF